MSNATYKAVKKSIQRVLSQFHLKKQLTIRLGCNYCCFKCLTPPQDITPACTHKDDNYNNNCRVTFEILILRSALARF